MNELKHYYPLTPTEEKPLDDKESSSLLDDLNDASGLELDEEKASVTPSSDGKPDQTEDERKGEEPGLVDVRDEGKMGQTGSGEKTKRTKPTDTNGKPVQFSCTF